MPIKIPKTYFITEDDVRAPDALAYKLNHVLKRIIDLANTNFTSIISDTAYDATTWDSDTTSGASKNALRDKFEALSTTSGAMAFTDTIGGSDNITFGSDGATVFNEQGNSVDFRIESNTDPNLFFLDGSTDRIGIGTSTPEVKFEVEFSGNDLVRVTSVTGDDTGIECYSGVTFVGGYLYDSAQAAMSFYGPNSNGYLHIKDGGAVPIAQIGGLGADTPGGKLHVKGGSDIIQFLVQAHSSQSANLAEWQDSGQNVQISFDGDGGAVFNEEQNSVDFRVEGNTESHLFFIDGSADRIGINNSTPGAKFDLTGSADEIQQIIKANSTQTTNLIEWQNSGGTALSWINGSGAADLAGLTINNTYTFPTSDGAANQVLKTDGAGTISFGSVSANLLADSDNDTKVQVEKNTDEDIIRFDTAGVESMRIMENQEVEMDYELRTQERPPLRYAMVV